MLPEDVLKKAAAEMLDYEGSGQSVMEMSHRSKVYDSIIKGAEQLLRELYNIPENYKVLFLQGGASTQFAAIPLNFMNKNGKADFVITGQWAKKAYQEAQKYGECKAVASSADKTFSYIPKLDKNEFTKDADYFYICMNNTIYGTVYHELPDTGDVPLIADISSCFLSEPLDISKFAMVYGGAQKNVAPAGLTICIIREDMLGNARDITPTMLNYQTHIDNGSMFNTPPVLPIYTALQTLKWLKAQGGLAEIEKKNIAKAELLYNAIDNSKMFVGTAAKEDRSLMNICFVMKDEYKDLEADFMKFATEKGMVGIKGHRSVGGFRASTYNALPIESVQALVDCIQEFEKLHA